MCTVNGEHLSHSRYLHESSLNCALLQQVPNKKVCDNKSGDIENSNCDQVLKYCLMDDRTPCYSRGKILCVLIVRNRTQWLVSRKLDSVKFDKLTPAQPRLT